MPDVEYRRRNLKKLTESEDQRHLEVYGYNSENIDILTMFNLPDSPDTTICIFKVDKDCNDAFPKIFLLSIVHTYGPIKLADISAIRSKIVLDNVQELIKLSRTVLKKEELYFSIEAVDVFGSIIESLLFSERNLDKYTELLKLREKYGYDEDVLLYTLASNLKSLMQYRSNTSPL